MSRTTTTATRRGWRLAAAMIAAAAAMCVLGPPSLAQAATTAPAKGIRQVACRSGTFNVHYGHNKEKCFSGHGTKSVAIPDVHLVTTGNNMGFFNYVRQRGTSRLAFVPHERLTFSGPSHVELVTIHIN